MSGGHFDYRQYQLMDDADEIDRLATEHEGDWHPATVAAFRRAARALRRAKVYMTRIDWFLCGDDSEDDMHRRLADDFRRLEL